MNFLAIPTLKNDRACFPLPISIMPLCSLNVTFDRERTGMARVGSLRRSAAVITVSATPTSFFSTALFVFPFFRVMMLPISSSALRVSCVPGHVACRDAVTCVKYFLDGEFEDVAAMVLALRPLASFKEGAQPAAAFAEGQRDLLRGLIVVGDRFLGFAGEGHPDRGHMDENHHGAGRERAFGLRHSVGAPGGVEHRLVDRAGGLLMEERHAVGVADDAGELAVVLLLLPFGLRYRLLLLALRCLLGSPAVGQARLDHEGVAAVHGWRPAHRRIEIPFDLLVQAGEDRLFADR